MTAMADLPDAPDSPSSKASGEERRRHPRAPIELEVDLQFESVQHFLSAHAEDISESGMFIRGWETTPDGKPREIGQTLSLRFDAGSERIVQGTARVVRVVRKTDGGEPGIGLQFVELDPQSRRLIEAIVRIKLA